MLCELTGAWEPWVAFSVTVPITYWPSMTRLASVAEREISSPDRSLPSGPAAESCARQGKRLGSVKGGITVAGTEERCRLHRAVNVFSFPCVRI